MTYTISIDQSFALVNNLTLTQVATLAAFLSLPTWADNIAINGSVWYMYSEEKMSKDYPLLFGVPKRCYKNITELADMGYVELTKLGRTKYVRFTERCRDWNRGKDQFCTESPKMDEIKSENGLKKSPKMDSNYNIINNSIINDYIPADGGLFPDEPMISKTPKQRGTTEPLCLFADSRYSNWDDFARCFNGAEYENIDLAYYYGAVADWSAKKGKKMRDWIATARGFIRSDIEKNKLHVVKQEESFDIEGFKKYCEM